MFLMNFGGVTLYYINHHILSSTKRVCDVIRTVLDIEQQGARIIQRDSETLVLVDYDCVSTHSLDLILEQFPCLQISTHSSDISSTGFIIVFVQPQVQSWYKKAAFIRFLVVFITFSLTAPSLTHHYSTLLSESFIRMT